MREYLTPERVANKIRLIRNNPVRNICSFLLLEGSTDANVYKRFINKDQCETIIAGNKNMAVQVLAILERDSFSGVLAIVDADFDVLGSNLPLSPNLLFTDAHDLESMITQSPALEHVLSELASQTKMDAFVKKCGKEIRLQLVECARPIGYLRWVSLRENMSLNFSDLNFSDVMRDSLEVDVIKLINLLRSRSYDGSKHKSSTQPPSNNDIHRRMTLLQDNAHDHWHLCCGHDITGILSFWLRKAIGDMMVKETYLEICLRLAYERAYFAKTKLYASIQQWEQNNPPFIVLRTE